MKLPADEAVEKALIGTALLSSESIPSILELSPEDFFYDAHRKMFERIVEHHSKSLPIDTTVFGRDGESYLEHFASDVEGYVRILKDKRTLRDVAKQCHATIKEISDGMDSQNVLVNLGRVLSQREQSSTLHSSAQSAIEVFERIKRIQAGEQELGISVDLDFEKPLGCFEAGKLYIIAARPAMGKSAFALEIAKRTADHGIPVGFMTLEMGHDAMSLRLIANMSGIEFGAIRSGKLGDDEMLRIADASAQYSNLPIYFDDNSFVTAQTLRARAHAMHQRYGIGMLIIDYLQLVSGSSERRELDIAETSRMCKIVSKELGIPVIALSQLNRMVEQRADKKPMLSDLRESGAIEQDADAVMMLYRPEYYDKFFYGDGDPMEWRGQSTKNILEVHIAKNRDGETGLVRQVFFKEYMQIRNRSAQI